jgi:hypothetical protein
VEESCEVTAELPSSSGSIFLASCFPSSTLPGQGEEGPRVAKCNPSVNPQAWPTLSATHPHWSKLLISQMMP